MKPKTLIIGYFHNPTFTSAQIMQTNINQETSELDDVIEQMHIYLQSILPKHDRIHIILRSPLKFL